MFDELVNFFGVKEQDSNCKSEEKADLLSPEEIYFKKLGEIIEHEKYTLDSSYIKGITHNSDEKERIMREIEEKNDLLYERNSRARSLEIEIYDEIKERMYDDLPNRGFRTMDYIDYDSREFEKIIRKKVRAESKSDIDDLRENLGINDLEDDIKTLKTQIDLLTNNDTLDAFNFIIKYDNGMVIDLDIDAKIHTGAYLGSKNDWYCKGVYFNKVDFSGIKGFTIKIKDDKDVEYNDDIKEVIEEKIDDIIEYFGKKRVLELEQIEIEKQRAKDKKYGDKYRELLELSPMDVDYQVQVDKMHLIADHGKDILKAQREIERLRDLDYGILELGEQNMTKESQEKTS